MSIEREHRRQKHRVSRSEARGRAVLVVQEHVGVIRSRAARVVPADVKVGEEDVLALAAVIGTVAFEDARAIPVWRLVGQGREARRVGSMKLARLARGKL